MLERVDDNAGYVVDNQDSTTARRPDVDLPVGRLLAVLAGLHKYRAQALKELARTADDAASDPSQSNVGNRSA
jgi:hypothetical protein